MHMWHCDVMYDVTVSFNDVMLTNNMTCFGCTASEVHLPKIAINDGSNVATAHPEHWVFHAMPHMYGWGVSIIKS